MSFMLGVLQEMDLLASPFVFLMQKRRRLQTYIGGIIMVMLCAIGITSLVIFSYRMYDFSEVSIINERSYDNTYEETILNSSNFMIALSLSKSGVKYSHDQTYFRPSITAYTMTTDQDGMIETTSMKFSLVNCTPEHFERFPNEFKKLKADSSLLCLNETNFVLNGSYGLSTYQFLRINIERCTNSSTSQIVCASPESISNISRDLRVDIYFEDNGDQVTNSKTPFRQFLNLHSVALDPQLSRKTDLFMKKTKTESDKGLFIRSDIEIEERMSYDYESTQIYTTDGLSFLKVFYRLSPNRVMNHRTYWKFSDVLARTMGILQTAFIVGQLIAALYSRFKIYELLINSAFVYQSDIETQEKESAPDPPFHNNDNEKEGRGKEFDPDNFLFANYYKEGDRDEGEVLRIAQEEQKNNESPVSESQTIRINMVNLDVGVDSNEHRGHPMASPESASANLVSNSLQTSRRLALKKKLKAAVKAYSSVRKIEKEAILAKSENYLEWVLQRKRFKRTKSLETDMIIRDDYIHFNFAMVLFPFLFKKKPVFESARALVDKYIDIEYIIEKIQEIDKLKSILLTREQILMMHFIPRPKILQSKENPGEYKIENNNLDDYFKEITKEKGKEIYNMYTELKEECEKRSNTNPVNERLLEFLDEEFKENMDKVILPCHNDT